MHPRKQQRGGSKRGPKRQAGSKRTFGSKRRQGPIKASRSKEKSSKIKLRSTAPVRTNASKATFTAVVEAKDRPVFKEFLFGLLGVVVLILVGGGHNPYAYALAMIMPGISLILRPPSISLGRYTDLGIAGILVAFLLAYFPLFSWMTPNWRIHAVDEFGIHLPSVISVHPLITIEGILLVVAGFSWLYASSSWTINHTGRKYMLFFISLAAGLLAEAAIVCNIYGIQFPGSDQTAVFSYFKDWDQMTNLLVIGGIVSFGYAIEGLKQKQLMHLVGAFSTALVIIALLQYPSQAGMLLYLTGIVIWFILRQRFAEMSLCSKCLIPLALIIFSIFVFNKQSTFTQIQGLFSFANNGWSEIPQFQVIITLFHIVLESPFSGIGLGNLESVYPQYIHSLDSFHQATSQRSDLLILAAEGGVIALISFGLILFGLFKFYVPRPNNRNAAYRVISLTCVIVFLLHGLYSEPGHNPGTLYFTVLIAGLNLPSYSGTKARFLSPFIWRCIGGLLVLIGLVWAIGQTASLPVHSIIIKSRLDQRIESALEKEDYTEAKETLDKVISSRPLSGNYYFNRAKVHLFGKGNLSAAEDDFLRARHLEPYNWKQLYEEGLVWIEYDLDRAISSWRNLLFSESVDREQLFDTMLIAGRENLALSNSLKHLSHEHSALRTQYLLSLDRDAFKNELLTDLDHDPSLAGFTNDQINAIVEIWITHGFIETAEKFLIQNKESLEQIWHFWALLNYSKTDFKEAVSIIRENVPAPEFPFVEINEKSFAVLNRGFSVDSKDVVKGTHLFRYYIERDLYDEALKILDLLTSLPNAPKYSFYWQGELHYKKKDYIKSWEAFQKYLEIKEN